MQSASRPQPPKQIRWSHLDTLEHHLDPVERPVMRMSPAERDTGREVPDEGQAPEVERAENPARGIAAGDTETTDADGRQQTGDECAGCLRDLDPRRRAVADLAVERRGVRN